jgi:hypothetical protein
LGTRIVPGSCVPENKCTAVILGSAPCTVYDPNPRTVLLLCACNRDPCRDPHDLGKPEPHGCFALRTRARVVSTQANSLARLLRGSRSCGQGDQSNRCDLIHQPSQIAKSCVCAHHNWKLTQIHRRGTIAQSEGTETCRHAFIQVQLSVSICNFTLSPLRRCFVICPATRKLSFTPRLAAGRLHKQSFSSQTGHTH